MTSVGTTSVVGVQLSWAVINAYVIQWLKKANFIPGVTFDTANINRVIAILFAAAASSGIGIVYDKSAGNLLITGISIVAIYHFISGTVQQFALQHAIYKGIIAPPLAGPVQEQIRKNGGISDGQAPTSSGPAVSSK